MKSLFRKILHVIFTIILGSVITYLSEYISFGMHIPIGWTGGFCIEDYYGFPLSFSSSNSYPDLSLSNSLIPGGCITDTNPIALFINIALYSIVIYFLIKKYSNRENSLINASLVDKNLKNS